MLKAVIFDLDGVVVDSHPIHEAAWKTLLVEQGLDSAALDLDFLYAGHPRLEILRHYLGSIEAQEMDRLGRRKDELYAAAAHELKTKPGILRVLSELSGAGILCALATSAGRTRAHESLEQLGIATDFSAASAAKPTNSQPACTAAREKNPEISSPTSAAHLVQTTPGQVRAQAIRFVQVSPTRATFLRTVVPAIAQRPRGHRWRCRNRRLSRTVRRCASSTLAHAHTDTKP